MFRVGSSKQEVGSREQGGLWVVFGADNPESLERCAFPDCRYASD